MMAAWALSLRWMRKAERLKWKNGLQYDNFDGLHDATGFQQAAKDFPSSAFMWLSDMPCALRHSFARLQHVCDQFFLKLGLSEAKTSRSTNETEMKRKTKPVVRTGKRKQMSFKLTAPSGRRTQLPLLRHPCTNAWHEGFQCQQWTIATLNSQLSMA